MLVLATVFLYWVLASSLAQEGMQFLADTIRVLRGIIRDHPNDLGALEDEVQSEVAARQYTKYYVRVLDAQGGTLLETLHMDDLFPPTVFSVTTGVLESPEEGVKWRAGDGRVYYLVAAWAQVGHDGAVRQLLQVGLDVSRRDATLAHYRRQLVIVLLLGIMFSAGAAIVVTRRGMRPLAEITQAARRVTARQLHERIGPVRWPQELTALALTFDSMLDRLEDSFTRLAQFSADLAHELRTPINNLMGEAEIALTRTRTLHEYQQVLGSSLEEYGRLSRLIDSLLFLARAESPETRIHRQLLDGRKELESVREFHEAVAEEQGVEVRCQGEALVQADPVLFPRAVSNLLSNALHYTPHGGKIVLSIYASEDYSTVISVHDTGVGIAPEHLPRLFDRFYRADPARSQCRPGMGLGLAIVKSTMVLHGGTVTIQSILGQGTTVTLRFPSPA
jgi:two-component system heavy metal sensor histidine kinase CusS